MSVRDRLRRALLGALDKRIDELEAQLDERISRLETAIGDGDEDWDRSRQRWRGAQPAADLTWDTELTGEAFIERANAHGAFGAERRVLEIGPGYGRLLASCLEQGLEFESWLGVDLSADCVAYLGRRFGRQGISFVEADVETIELDQPVDTILSSLTFKHLFPSFDVALRNLARQLRPDGVVIFDLIEGRWRSFENDRGTYVRRYTRDEVDAIVAGAGLTRIAFDEVRHHPDITRLLVVAGCPKSS
jgi:SAM-dependent methyltransferase